MVTEYKMTRRDKVLLSLLCISVFLAILAVGLFFTNNKSKRNDYMKFDEKYNASYIVQLRNNDHFGNSMNSGNVYISSLVYNIRNNLSYRLEYSDVNVETEYTYNVYVLMEINVKDQKKPVYTKRNVVKSVITPIEAKNVIIFNEVVDVNYSTYLLEAKNFALEYGLSNTTTNLTVVLEVSSTAKHDEFVKDSKLNTSVKVNIPVNDSTFVVDVVESSTRDERVLLKSSSSNHLGTTSVVYAIFAVGVFVLRVVYKKKTRDDKEIYSDRLEDIMSNYDSYIQKVNGDISYDGFDFIEVDDIEDLLEIKETINLPILMIERDVMTDFVILNKNNLSYIYRLEEGAK